MNTFNWLEEIVIKLSNPKFEWLKEIREKDFEKKDFPNMPKPIHIESKSWISKNKACNLRFSRFTSTVIDVSTIVLFPFEVTKNTPLFVIELVAVSNNIPVIVLDVEFLACKTPQYFSLKEIHTKWEKEFPLKDKIPEWFSSIQSPFAIFSHSTNENITQIKQLIYDYLEFFNQNYYLENKKLVDSIKDSDEIKNYKRHHIACSPAYQVIQQDDRQWLTEFLTNYHFKTYY